MFRLHIELGCHLVAVVAVEVVVKGLSVAADASSDACGMRCEDGRNLWRVGFQIEQSHAGGPLVELSDNTVVFFAKNFDKLSITMAEAMANAQPSP